MTNDDIGTVVSPTTTPTNKILTEIEINLSNKIEERNIDHYSTTMAEFYNIGVQQTIGTI